jgi:putative transposase
MPRAHRHFLPGQIWHITHRCHKKEFLLKFARDRRLWIGWLYEARCRYGLSVLNYAVTSNHIHLLVRDTDEAVIPASLQLIAGRTAQAYNRRKERPGAFWEDRYHATAIATDDHLWRCLVYIDLNMVRAGVVAHPSQWPHGGYHEIVSPRPRRGILDHTALLTLGDFRDLATLQQAHRQWITEALTRVPAREPRWSTALAVGNEAFVAQVQSSLSINARYREISSEDDTYELREETEDYGFDSENVRIRPSK